MKFLSGDVGGTNVRLRLSTGYDRNDVICTIKYPTNKYNTFEDVLKCFMKDSKIKTSDLISVCIAVAGPVEKGSVKFSNLPWLIEESSIADFLGLPIKKVKLINDFVAVGYGVHTLNEEDLLTLQKGEHEPDSVIAVIGAGTGLGMCIVDNYNVIATEGGHQGFAPVSEKEIELLTYLRQKLHRVSVERVCSGPGIANLYEYAKSFPLYNQQESPELRRLLYSCKPSEKAALISQHAQIEKDPMSLRALDMFISIYGSAAGDLALGVLPYAGLYIAGGIAPKLQREIREGNFMKRFLDKGRIRGALSNIPVHMILNEDVGLQGATLYAVQLLVDLPNENTNAPASTESTLA